VLDALDRWWCDLFKWHSRLWVDQSSVPDKLEADDGLGCVADLNFFLIFFPPFFQVHVREEAKVDTTAGFVPSDVEMKTGFNLVREEEEVDLKDPVQG
jgi:hypothetical protein